MYDTRQKCCNVGENKIYVYLLFLIKKNRCVVLWVLILDFVMKTNSKVSFTFIYHCRYGGGLVEFF